MAVPDLGIMFRREDLPENIVAFSQRAEAAGFDEVWIVEDCFYASGVAPAAAALVGTGRIRVGLGIMPAVVRNAAFTAMEIATLARLAPGRFLPGLGHGLAAWMKQIGALPPSQLAALGETTDVVRRLLRGEPVDFQGEHVMLDKGRLKFPPTDVPPVALGVRGPRSLRLAGRLADGAILAEGSSPSLVSWAREHIEWGRAEAGRRDDHRITVYIWCAVDDDAAAARARVRPWIAPGLVHGDSTYRDALGHRAAIEALIAQGGPDPVGHVARAMPDDWLGELAVVGTPQQGAATIRRLAAAGADSVVLVPLPSGDFTAQLDSFARTILPAVRGGPSQ